LRQKVNPARQIVTLPVAAVPVHVQSRSNVSRHLSGTKRHHQGTLIDANGR
jgi:hypothetical protein